MPKNNRYLWTTRWQRILLLTLLFTCRFSLSSAQAEGVKTYTEENPLVYEDAWDLWPYSYINDDGQPEGYNIDLIGLLMNKLNIPYVIRLKHQQQVFEDLKDKQSR